MPLINCKIHLELNWNNNCVMYGADTYAGGDNGDEMIKEKETITQLVAYSIINTSKIITN